MNISTLARNVCGNGLVDLLDTGSTHPNAYLEVRTGSKPVSPQASAAATSLLAVISCAKPAFKDFSNGAGLANPCAISSVVASGTATWFRAFNRDGVAIFDGDVTVTGQQPAGEMVLATRDFVVGGTLVVTLFSVTFPQ